MSGEMPHVGAARLLKSGSSLAMKEFRMEQEDQPQPRPLTGADDADGALRRLVGQRVLEYTLLTHAMPSNSAMFHGHLRDIYPNSIVFEAAPGGNRVVARSFLIYKHAIVAIEPAAPLNLPPDHQQPLF
jgi:hypothetical protein